MPNTIPNEPRERDERDVPPETGRQRGESGERQADDGECDEDALTSAMVGDRGDGERRERGQADDRESEPDGRRRQPDLCGQVVAAADLTEGGRDVADDRGHAELGDPRADRQA